MLTMAPQTGRHKETRSGSTSQHMFLNLVRSKRYDELSFATPLRFARTGHRPEAGLASERTCAHFGFRDRRAKGIRVSRLRGLPEDSSDFPGKETLDELIGDLPVDESFAEANRRAASQIYIPSWIAAWRQNEHIFHSTAASNSLAVI